MKGINKMDAMTALMINIKENTEGKTIDSCIQSDPLGSKSSTEGMEVRDLTGGSDRLKLHVRGNSKSGDDSSKYVASFMGKPEGNLPFKEDTRMSVIDKLLERAELKNSRGTVGIGKEDEVLGAPNSKSEIAIDDGKKKLEAAAEKLDSEADTSNKQTELFGEKDVAGKKVAEASFIETKQDYEVVVEALVTHLVEMSLLSYVEETFVGTKEYDQLLEDYIGGVLEGAAPTGWGMMEESTKEFLAERILFFKERRDQMLASPTKRSAALVEEYYTDTVKLLSAIPKSMSARITVPE